MNTNYVLQNALIQARELAKNISGLEKNLKIARENLSVTLRSKMGITPAQHVALGVLFNGDPDILIHYVGAHFNIKIGGLLADSVQGAHGAAAYDAFRAIILDGVGDNLDAIIEKDADAKDFLDILSMLANTPDSLGSLVPSSIPGQPGYVLPRGLGEHPFTVQTNPQYGGSGNEYARSWDNVFCQAEQPSVPQDGDNVGATKHVRGSRMTFGE